MLAANGRRARDRALGEFAARRVAHPAPEHGEIEGRHTQPRDRQQPQVEDDRAADADGQYPADSLRDSHLLRLSCLTRWVDETTIQVEVNFKSRGSRGY